MHIPDLNLISYACFSSGSEVRKFKPKSPSFTRQLLTLSNWASAHSQIMTVAGENIVTNNNLGKNNLSITTYAITTW